MKTIDKNTAYKELTKHLSRVVRIKPRMSCYDWLKDNKIRVPHSAQATHFDYRLTPWLVEPLKEIGLGKCEIMDIAGCVQAGKSSLGEAAIQFLTDTDPANMLYNWEDQGKAEQLWDERVKPMIEQNPYIKSKVVGGIAKMRKCSVQLVTGHNIIVQGIHAEKSRQSRSIRYLINEEVKDWEVGEYTDILKRTTAFWNRFVLNISPASTYASDTQTGDEFYQSFSNGTQKVWNIRCEGCGKLQPPNFDVEEGKLGGVKWDQTEAVRDDFDNLIWTKVAPTIYWECPECGHKHYDTPKTRNIMMNGAYVQMNSNPAPRHESYLFTGLSVPWVKFIDLVHEFTEARRYAKYGNPDHLREFYQKRLTRFWDTAIKTTGESIVRVRKGIKKGGQDKPDITLMTVDRQIDHFWVVVRDWKRIKDEPGSEGKFLRTHLLFEGKVWSEDEVEATRRKFNVKPQFVIVDSGDEAAQVYRMCASYGYNAIKGASSESFTHILPNGKTVSKIFAKPTSVDSYKGSVGSGVAYVSLFLYSKHSIRERYNHFLNDPSIDYVIPDDVSDDYLNHHKSEVRARVKTATGHYKTVWKQIAKRNDLFVCECYQVLLATILKIATYIGEDESGDVTTRVDKSLTTEK